MNPEQALLKIEEVIKNRELSNTGRYHLGLYDGIIVCIPTDKKPKPWPVLALLSESDLRDGLHNSQWNNIKKKIATLDEFKGET